MNALEKYAARKKLAAGILEGLKKLPTREKLILAGLGGVVVGKNIGRYQGRKQAKGKKKTAADPAAQQRMQQAPPANSRIQHMNLKGSTITARPDGQPTQAQLQAQQAINRLGLGKTGPLANLLRDGKKLTDQKFVSRATSGGGAPAPGFSLSPFGPAKSKAPAPSMRTATSVGGPPQAPPTAVTTR